MKEINLTPDYANTVRWFANALATHSFEFGAIAPVISFIEQVRYLYQTNPDELERILNELRKRDELNG